MEIKAADTVNKTLMHSKAAIHMVNSLLVETLTRNKVAILIANKLRHRPLKAATAVSSNLAKGNTDRPAMAQRAVPMVRLHDWEVGNLQANDIRRRQ